MPIHVANSTEDLRKCDVIKVYLSKYCLTQQWLLLQLEVMNIITDKTELSAILSDRRAGPKADRIIQASLEVLEGYAIASQKRWCDYIS